MSDIPVIELKKISKKYNGTEMFVLKDISLEIKRGEFIALIGPSGSGKSTLLHLIGLLDNPTNGEIFINGKRSDNLSDEKKTNLRLEKLGFVYQYHHLLPEFSAIENVILPQLIKGENINKKKIYEKSEDLLIQLGLKDKINSKPSELSGGQRQRVAIARAISNNPEILLADEPTGNLDKENAALVFDDLVKLAEKNKMCAIIATHNEDLVKKMSRSFYISEGRLLRK